MNWKIEQLWVKPAEGPFTDVVVTAAWRCSAEQSVNGGTYYGTAYSTTTFVAPDPLNFTPYSDLTEADVLQWVWSNGVDKDETEAIVSKQIDDQINPPIITPELPWISK